MGKDASWTQLPAPARIITHAGNTGLTARAYLADGSPGPFVELGKLSYGDQIIVHLDGQRYVYEVRSAICHKRIADRIT